MNNDCKGCPTGIECSFKSFANKCPCKKCLVKASCSSICDPYIEFLHYTLSIQHEGYKDTPILKKQTEPISNRIKNMIKYVAFVQVKRREKAGELAGK